MPTLKPEEIHLSWREAASGAGLAFVLGAVFPRLAYRVRWPTRLSARGVVVYIALNTILEFALRAWALPLFRRLADERTQAENDLRHQLGRGPTDDELWARLVCQQDV